MSLFSERLAWKRVEKGFTYRELAKATGISKATLQRYEHDLTDPPTSKINILADVLGVQREWLAGYEEKPTDTSSARQALIELIKGMSEEDAEHLLHLLDRR